MQYENRLAAICVADTCAFYITGQYVVSLDSICFLSGTSGVLNRVANIGNQGVYMFDNFELRLPL